MTVSSTVNKLLKGFSGKKKANPVSIIAKRFIQIFEDHGVAASQIPRLLPQIKLSDLKSEESLLQVLNHEILDQAAQLFGIRSQWLEGIDDQIYEIHHCYKYPKEFFDDLASFCHRKDNGLYLPVRAFTTRKNLDYTNPEKQPLVLILVEQFAILDDKQIFRYRIFNDEWDWFYVPARIQVKAMVRLVSMIIDVPVPLYIIKIHELQGLFDGAIIPRYLIDNRWLSDPSLDDFVTTNKFVGKEIDELPEVLMYIEEYQLRNLITEDQGKCDPTFQASEVSPIQSAKSLKTPGSGKRAKNQEDVWIPARDVAKKLWRENNSLSIAEVIRCIKDMSLLKASGCGESGIRKKIVDLAPEGVRGKSGRKRK